MDFTDGFLLIIFLFSDLITEEALIILYTNEMEEASNKRNALASLTDDVVLEILRQLPACSLFCCKCVCHSWKKLILDPKNHKKLPQTMVGFFYDSEDDNQNFTSVVRGVRPRSLEFLFFNIENVAISDCCNGLMLC